MRWGMVIDTRRCVGCQTCTIACKQEHGLPPGTQWRFVADCEIGAYPEVRRLFLPMQCMHCAEPPCVPVCPTGASRQRGDGIVWVETAVCVGCGYCAVACPYQARHLIHDTAGSFGAPTPAEAAAARSERHGVMTKCTFCRDRVDAGLARGLTPGIDPEATPMCAVACLTNAIVFGDLEDPASRVSQLRQHAVALSPECGTEPSVYYLDEEHVGESRSAACFPGRSERWGSGGHFGAPSSLGDRMTTVGTPVALIPSRPQTWWAAPAVANFFLGGLGAGFYLIAAVTAPGSGGSPALLTASWLSPLLIFAGFAAVATEAGRPLRGPRVLARVATSWMSREVWLGAGFAAAAGAELGAPSLLARAAAVLLAVAFIVAQGCIVRQARGVAAWSVGVMPVLFLASAVVSGAGLYGLVLAATGGVDPTMLAVMSVVSVVGMIVWLVYLTWTSDPAFTEATHALTTGRRSMELAGASYFAPFVLTGLALALPGLAEAAAALAGLLMVVGQLRTKHALILTAGRLRPITLAHRPTWGAPTWPPTPPSTRSAPGNPWRSSVTRNSSPCGRMS